MTCEPELALLAEVVARTVVDDQEGLATPLTRSRSAATRLHCRGLTAGSHTFADLSSGTYVARAFLNESYVVAAENPAFEVQ
jgi:hypothetical protein